MNPNDFVKRILNGTFIMPKIIKKYKFNFACPLGVLKPTAATTPIDCDIIRIANIYKTFKVASL